MTEKMVDSICSSAFLIAASVSIASGFIGRWPKLFTIIITRGDVVNDSEAVQRNSTTSGSLTV